MLEGDASILERRLTVVKVAKPNQDMRFDIPVIGLPTLKLMSEVNATALAIDAYRTLLIDRQSLLAFADQQRITISAFPPEQ